MSALFSLTRECDQLEFPSLMFPRERKILAVAEVAMKLDVSERHVIDLIQEGKLRALNVGGDHASGRHCYRIPVEAYEAFIRAAVL